MVRLFSQSGHGTLLPEGYPKMWLQLEGGATLAALSYIYQQLRGSWCADCGIRSAIVSLTLS